MAVGQEKPENNEDLHQWATALVDDGRSRRRALEGQWWENIALYCGDLWSEWDPHKRRLTETKKPEYKVRLPINLAQPVIRTELAKLTKNRPIVDVMARSDEESDLNAAEVGDKILNNYVEQQFNMSRVRRRMLMWVLTTGMGGLFIDWDDSAETQIEVLADAQGNPVFDPQVIEAFRGYYKKQKKAPKTMTVPQGDLRIRPVSGFNVLWDFSQTYIEDASWCIISEVYDVHEVERRWNASVEGEKDAVPGIVERRLLERLDYNAELGLEQDQHRTQEMVKIHRLYVKPGHPFFPSGLHLVYTENEIIFKEGYTFDHGELPVAMMGHIPQPTSQYPMSILSQIKGPVLEVSRTASQLIENRNLMANPPWIIPQQVQLSSELENRPGMRLKFTFVPNVPEPHPVQMPEMPVYVQNLMDNLKQVVLEISGQGETSQGRVPPGARSGVAIAYLQEEDDTRLGPTVQEYEECIQRSSWQILRVIAERYDTPRTVRIYKPHSAPEVVDFTGTMLEGIPGVVCQAGSALPRSKAAKQQYILDLWDRKIETDPRRLRQMLELAEGDPDEYERDVNEAERENRHLSKGQQVQVEDWQNHQAHQLVHRRKMKSNEWDEMDDNLKDVYREHDQAHTDALNHQAQQQAIQQMQAQASANGSGPQNGAMPQPGGAPPGPPSDATLPGNGDNAQGPQPGMAPQASPRDLLSDQPQ